MNHDSRLGAMQAENSVAPIDFKAKIRSLRLKVALENFYAAKYATATEQLLELYLERPMTPEGSQAASLLSDLAAHYETSGKSRLALELLEKLSKAS